MCSVSQKFLRALRTFFVAGLALFEGPRVPHVDRVNVFQAVLLGAAHTGLEPGIEHDRPVGAQKIARSDCASRASFRLRARQQNPSARKDKRAPRAGNGALSSRKHSGRGREVTSRAPIPGSARALACTVWRLAETGDGSKAVSWFSSARDRVCGEAPQTAREGACAPQNFPPRGGAIFSKRLNFW